MKINIFAKLQIEDVGVFIKLYRNLRYTGYLFIRPLGQQGGFSEPDSRILIISSTTRKLKLLGIYRIL